MVLKGEKIVAGCDPCHLLQVFTSFVFQSTYSWSHMRPAWVSSGQSGYLCALEVLGLERNLSINGLYIKDSEVVLLRRKGC